MKHLMSALIVASVFAAAFLCIRAGDAGWTAFAREHGCAADARIGGPGKGEFAVCDDGTRVWRTYVGRME